ncbi:hypothetical protein DL93DRAFT_2088359 [Clavulina sp. PMI_390]|nr:hypothetical protein DL93DRAFT_2088359 [Clavulina sp. PMI_390]
MIDMTVTSKYSRIGDVGQVEEFYSLWDLGESHVEAVEIKLEHLRNAKPMVQGLSLLSSLKRLKIVDTYPRYLVLDALGDCTQIEHFDWEYSQEGTIWEADFSPLSLPHLKSLSLRAFALWDGFPFLVASNCEALCLHKLDLPLSLGPILPPPFALNPVIFPQLKRLSLIQTGGFDSNICTFLKRHHTLEEVFINATHSGSQIDTQCDLLDILATGSEFQTIGNAQVSPESLEGFLPSFHVLCYSTLAKDWAALEGGTEEAGPTLPEALRRLLSQRPSLHLKLGFDTEDAGSLPHDVKLLLEEFGERAVVACPGAEPNWAKPWEFTEIV